MSIVDFNDRMREYGDTLRFLQPSSRKGSKRSADADWNALESITEEDICTATFNALPGEYRTHIDGQFEVNFRDMDEIEFLNAMLSYETINKARRAKANKEKEKKKESALKKSTPRKRGGDDLEDPRRTQRPYARPTSGYQGGKPTGRVKKFCQYCKENNGKYWTHNTEECFMKDKANNVKKESNAMEDMQKEMNEMRNLVKGLKKKLGSDSDSN